MARIQRMGHGARRRSGRGRAGVHLPVLAAAAGLLLGGAGAARAELGNDLLDDVTQPGLLDVSRVAGSMPAGADVVPGIETQQSKVLDVSPELENGTDVGFGFQKIDSKTHLGKAGVILGDVDGGETDVRGGFYIGNAKGVVIFAFQLGEPDHLKRSADQVLVSQSRDVAVFVNVSWLSDVPNSETDIAVVPKCSVKTTFSDKHGDNIDENLPDFGSWKVSCGKGWSKALAGLSKDARKAIDKVLGDKTVDVKGSGKWLDIDQALADFEIPFL